MTKKKLLALSLATTLLVGVGAASLHLPTISPVDKVVDVVDGDTFFLQNLQPIRLKGLDAPELQNCYGQQSKAALEKLILTKKVTIREPMVDSYRRIIALVYVDGVSVSEYMIKNGFAYFRSASTSELSKFQAASDLARKNKTGIFSSQCYQINPPDQKCPIKGNFDDNSDRKIYFLPTCSYYDKTVIMKFRGEQWFCSEKEAKAAGFEKSKYCK